MIGALVELLISWILLHFIEHQSLEAIGFIPTPRRLKLAGIGFLLTAVFMILYFLGEAAILHTPYNPNPMFSVPPFLNSMWYFFKSVLFEELLFRGALFYILIKRLGAGKAVIISAVAFGIYHFFTVHPGSPVQFVILFLTTGLMGYAFARAFVISGSILVPFAIHYALNFVSYTIFGTQPGFQPFLHSTSALHPAMAIGLVLLVIHNFGYPLVVLWWLHKVKPAQTGFKK